MPEPFPLPLDRSIRTPLVEQIRQGISHAIASGVLSPEARLPSWRDLAAQLGVSRGTVRAAYERLLDEQLIVSSQAAGTRVARRPPAPLKDKRAVPDGDDIPSAYRDFAGSSGIFQMGVPALDIFPAKLFARIRARAARAELATLAYPDPCGHGDLRREIAAHLTISRSLECSPSQIIMTAGFTGALGLALSVIRPNGQTAWMEEPGFPLTRRGLQLAGARTIPIPIDAGGMDVGFGIRHAPTASLAVVTAGQQAPTGATLPLERRLALIDWAVRSGAWIIEDDYLGELQIEGRAAPALASLDTTGRVIYVGSFSKTISPTLRLGFLVAPAEIATDLADAAACLAPAPGPAVQQAVAEFMHDGHYLRHLRRSKRTYADRREALKACLEPLGLNVRAAGLSLILELPSQARDRTIARQAHAFGLAPSPLSTWYGTPERGRRGLLLGITRANDPGIVGACERLHQLISAYS